MLARDKKGENLFLIKRKREASHQSNKMLQAFNKFEGASKQAPRCYVLALGIIINSTASGPAATDGLVIYTYTKVRVLRRTDAALSLSIYSTCIRGQIKIH